MNIFAPWVWFFLGVVVTFWIIFVFKLSDYWQCLYHRKGESLVDGGASANVVALADNNTIEAADKLRRIVEDMEAGEIKVKYGAAVLKTNDSVTVVEFGYAASSERLGVLLQAALQSYEDR